MEIIISIFHSFIVNPIINVLVAIYQVLFALHVPYALGFSIIILTIVIRLILYPLISSQLKASKKMQEISPHLSKLKDKHKNPAELISKIGPLILIVPFLTFLFQFIQSKMMIPQNKDKEKSKDKNKEKKKDD